MTDLAGGVGELRERSPFYRDKLAGFEDASFEDLPFTTKDEIRESLAAEPPLGRHLAAPVEAVRRVYSTSGTTGDPSYIAVTDADLATWTEIGSRSYAATGIAPAQRARWDARRRMDLVLDLLRDASLDALLTGETPFESLPQTMKALAASAGDTLCHVVRYE